jgi:translation initiation factor 5B
MDAFSMKALDQLGSVIISFGVKTEADAHEEAAASGVTIIEGSIIYKLIDDYKEYITKKKGDAAKAVEDMVVFPGEIYLIPNSCFRVSGPAIFGVQVKEGRIRPGYVLINEAGVVIGRIKGIQSDKNALPEARKGESVAVSVEGPTYGRQIKENQTLYTRPTDSDEGTLLGAQRGLIDDDEAVLLRRIIEIKRKAKER